MKYLLFLILPLFLFSCKKEENNNNDQPIEGLQEITSLNQINTEIADGVSLIFYHASWCHICQDQRPAVTNTAEDAALNTVFFGEVEYDDFPEIIEEYNINGFPTLVIYKDGTEVDRFAGGGHSAAELKTAIQAHI